MIDETDNTTPDTALELRTDAARFTLMPSIAGFGTGTQAELEFHIAQITDERDTLRKEARSATTNAALGLYDAFFNASQAAMADLMATVEEQGDEINALRVDLEASWISDGPDVDAIWAEIEDRVDEAAAEAARQVIRDELVASVDLI